ncbi:hypothetical protein CCU68_25895 [Pseudomonas gingeri NCPPB 3146 = LMG 5327]|uniref:Uncharacterized protein n=2 Tax=Pseudomonas gingeri TaxID=117681 RepID=A0A7Y8CLI8_9PSED|nr:hypothetical protein [Pseudomonas gingeri]NVZ64066.1 hypothetical protein [Pseudomonas gingeri]NVZ78732.1 hypothetical protein [Pseudomonas gingeri]NWB29005.1 hypothetical protein [Pseudomonas gingeri]NWC13977.1 hypothetical protein [Pseudomonas gingeri]NWC34099.1 hypothetical protein [Pseudomonas gingeri]
MSDNGPSENNPIYYEGYTITSEVKNKAPFYVLRPGGGQLVNDADPDADPYASTGGFGSIEDAKARIDESNAN